MIKELSDSVWVVEDKKLAIVFSSNTIQDDCGKVTSTMLPGLDKAVEIMYWGQKNTLPQEREELVRNNGILGELIRTKRDFIIGGGLVHFRRKWVDGKEVKEYVETPPAIAAFLKKIKIRKYFRKACKNLLIHGNVFTEFVRLKRADGGKFRIASMKAMECRHIRAERQNSDGEVPGYWWSGDWQKTKKRDIKQVLPAFYIPTHDAEKPQPKFMLHTGDDLIYDDYYYGPTWWGKQVVKMIQVANTIPEFHLANINNGYSIRFWIEVPKDYFVDATSKAQTPENKADALKKETEAKKEFKTKMNEFLAGAENAGRAVFSEYEVNRQLGKEFPGVKIHTLDYDMKGDELLKLYAAALQTLTASQGIHPTLANVDTAGKLSSGSEMRNAHMVYLKTKTPESRAIILEAYELLHDEMEWDPELFAEFRDVEITKLDETKAGFIDNTQTDAPVEQP